MTYLRYNDDKQVIEIPDHLQGDMDAQHELIATMCGLNKTDPMTPYEIAYNMSPATKEDYEHYISSRRSKGLFHYQILSSIDPTDIIVDTRLNEHIKPVSYPEVHIIGEAVLKSLGISPDIYYVKAIPVA